MYAMILAVGLATAGADDKKAEANPAPAAKDVAGTWKAKALFIKGKGMLIQNLELTIKADGKGDIVYRVERGGGRFEVTAGTVVIKQEKTKTKDGKELAFTSLNGFAGMEWFVRLTAKGELELFAVVPTADGASIEKLYLTKEPAKAKDKP